MKEPSMTVDTAATAAATGARLPLLSRLAAFAASFRWAMEVQRRFERESARGHRLDGDAVRRIVSETDAWLESR